MQTEPPPLLPSTSLNRGAEGFLGQARRPLSRGSCGWGGFVLSSPCLISPCVCEATWPRQVDWYPLKGESLRRLAKIHVRSVKTNSMNNSSLEKTRRGCEKEAGRLFCARSAGGPSRRSSALITSRRSAAAARPPRSLLRRRLAFHGAGD